MTTFKKQKGWGMQSDNEVLGGDGFFVSYNANTGSKISCFAGDGEGDETALVKGDKFYILNGDFRKEYSELVEKDYGKCKKFFDSKKAKYQSSWSN